MRKLSSYSLAIVLAAALVMMMPPAAEAGTLRNIDMEGVAQVNSNWTLTDGGITYNIVRGGVAQRKPLKDSANAFAGTYGLTFQIDSAGTSTQSQRTEYKLASSSSLFPRYTSRFIGFAIKVPSNFPIPSNWTTVAQVYDAGGCSPPMGFKLINKSGQLGYQVRVRNDDKNRCNGLGSYYAVQSRTMPRGSWQRFVFEVRLAPEGGGIVKVWHNGQVVGQYSGKVGLSSGRTYGEAKFGLYRGPQSNSMRVSFDNVKFGTTYASADPGTGNPPGGGVANADFVSQSIPGSLRVGEQRRVYITMRNNGTKTWTRTGFQQGSQNPQDNWIWGLNRIALTRDVRPNEEYTFAFNIIAPLEPGAYNFQRRMVELGVAWFGDYTPNRVITVNP